MSYFRYTEIYEPDHGLYADRIARVMSMAQAAFQISGWVDAEGRLVPSSENGVASHIRLMFSEDDLEEFGGAWVLGPEGDESSVLLKFCTGGGHWTKNFSSVEFPGTLRTPEVDRFKELIDSHLPTEAYLLEEENNRLLRKKWSARGGGCVLTALHWLHYLGSGLVDALGGTAHCYAAPVYYAERRADGVMFQMSESLSDIENPNYLRTQLQVLNHFCPE